MLVSLPASSSILASDHLLTFLRQTYRLGALATCRLIKAGVNHTYQITDDDRRFVFRVYSLNWRTRTDVEEEVRLLTYLRDGGIPVSYALPDQSGQYIQEIAAPEGTRYGVMFSQAEGQKLLTFSADSHEQLGRIMARLHQLTEGYALNRVTYTTGYLLDDALPEIAAFLPANSPELRFLRDMRGQITDELNHADQTQIRQGVVHMDIWFDNMNISPSGDATLFDFDFCGNGPLALDIGYYLMQLHGTETDSAEFQIKRDRFLSGYEAVQPISAEEKRIIPLLGPAIYCFYLGVQCARFDNWSNVFLNEIHLQRLINLRIKRWHDFNALGQAR